MVARAGGAIGKGGGGEVTQTLKMFRQPLVLGLSSEPTTPTDEQLAKINALPQVLIPRTADGVLVFGMYLMNTMPMHNGLQMDAAMPVAAAPMVVGKPVMRNHSTNESDDMPVARYFDARAMSRGDGDPWLAADVFTLADDDGHKLVNRVVGGLWSENSPTVLYRKLSCSICGKEDLRCVHVPLKEYDGRLCTMVMSDLVDVPEGSLTWAGMQRDTGFYLAAGKSVQAVDTLTMLEQRKQHDLDSWESRFARWWKS